jgi:CRAL/TRIO, N-terminal domain
MVILSEWMIQRWYPHYFILVTDLQLRFLRARKFDVDKAYIMFTDCEKWRTEFGVDEIIKTFKFDENPLVTVYYPRYYHKTDKVQLSVDYAHGHRMDDLSTLNSSARSI